MDGTFYEIFLWWGTPCTLWVGGVSHTYHFILKFFTKIVLLRAQIYVENFYESIFIKICQKIFGFWDDMRGFQSPPSGL